MGGCLVTWIGTGWSMGLEPSEAAGPYGTQTLYLSVLSKCKVTLTLALARISEQGEHSSSSLAICQMLYDWSLYIPVDLLNHSVFVYFRVLGVGVV